jgi:hypothetical protein
MGRTQQPGPWDVVKVERIPVPPLPPGYKLEDNAPPPLPPGYRLDDSSGSRAHATTGDGWNVVSTAPIQKPMQHIDTHGVTASAAPPQSAYQRFKNMLANSAVGHSVESTMPRVANAIDLHPTTAYGPEYERQGEQLISPEALVPGNPTSAAGQIGKGVLRGTGEMTSAPAMATAAGVAATGGLAEGVPAAGAAIKYGAGATGAYQTLKSLLAAKQLRSQGRTAESNEALGGVIPGAVAMLPAAAEAVGKVTSRGGPRPELDEVIPGDTVTPRQQYEDAQARGVNLDRAQATGSPKSSAAKKIVEHSLGGRSAFEANTKSNLNALDAWANDLQSPAVQNGKPGTPLMSREQFGNAAKQALTEHQQRLNEDAGKIYDDLTQRVGNVQPDTSDVSDLAKKIVDENKDYYAEHPELLKGGAGHAWNIVNDLARTEKAPAKTVPTGLMDADGKPLTRDVPAVPREPASWSDLHRLRSDLMDQYRSPDLVGSRAEGWLKQLVGGVDNSMTGAASKLSSGDQARFRMANDLYSQMKGSYDDPTHPFYSIIRAPDGLTAANTLHGLKPEIARQFTTAAQEAYRPNLIDQYQRQTMSRLLDPNGDGTFDLKNLPSRLNRQNMEQLQGVLSPDQITDLQSLARTSKLVHADSNPSGTAKVAQPAGEAAAYGMSALSGIGDAATGNLGGAVGRFAPLAVPLIERGASKYLTNPERTAAAFEPSTPSRVAQMAEAVPQPVQTGLATLAAEQPTPDDKPQFDVETGTGGDLDPQVPQATQPAVTEQVSPDSHDFSTKAWVQANPDGDPDEARQAAQTLGYNVAD